MCLRMLANEHLDQILFYLYINEIIYYIIYYIYYTYIHWQQNTCDQLCLGLIQQYALAISLALRALWTVGLLVDLHDLQVGGYPACRNMESSAYTPRDLLESSWKWSSPPVWYTDFIVVQGGILHDDSRDLSQHEAR